MTKAAGIKAVCFMEAVIARGQTQRHGDGLRHAHGGRHTAIETGGHGERQLLYC